MGEQLACPRARSAQAPTWSLAAAASGPERQWRSHPRPRHQQCPPRHPSQHHCRGRWPGALERAVPGRRTSRLPAQAWHAPARAASQGVSRADVCSVLILNLLHIFTVQTRRGAPFPLLHAPALRRALAVRPASTAFWLDARSGTASASRAPAVPRPCATQPSRTCCRCLAGRRTHWPLRPAAPPRRSPAQPAHAPGLLSAATSLWLAPTTPKRKRTQCRFKQHDRIMTNGTARMLQKTQSLEVQGLLQQDLTRTPDSCRCKEVGPPRKR